ncbi:hypothetical protein [Sphingomonas sp. UYP23]
MKVEAFIDKPLLRFADPYSDRQHLQIARYDDIGADHDAARVSWLGEVRHDRLDPLHEAHVAGHAQIDHTVCGSDGIRQRPASKSAYAHPRAAFDEQADASFDGRIVQVVNEIPNGPIHAGFAAHL